MGFPSGRYLPSASLPLRAALRGSGLVLLRADLFALCCGEVAFVCAVVDQSHQSTTSFLSSSRNPVPNPSRAYAVRHMEPT